MAGGFSNQVVMITGASGNVGSTVARHFAGEAAKLALIDHRQENLRKLVEEINLDRVDCYGITGDVTDVADVNRMVEDVLAYFGHIDALVHTVGGFAAGTPVHDAGIDVWERMMALNARSVYIVCGRVAKHMVERGEGGKIVAILARNAVQGSRNAGAYSASKAAAQRIIESMSAELRNLGINVNGIMPSNIDTPQNRDAMPDADFETWVTTDDIAEAALFLSSQAANAINGASLPVYGCT